MRHRKQKITFGRRTKQRKALLNNLSASLIIHNRIETTLSKAKEVSKIADRLVSFGKRNTVHSRRQAYKILGKRNLVKKLFDEIAPNYKKRNGGYTRVIKTRVRKGDAVSLAILEFVEKEKQTEKTKTVKENIKSKQLTKKKSDKKDKKKTAKSNNVSDEIPSKKKKT